MTIENKKANNLLLSDFKKVPKVLITGTPRSGTTMMSVELTNGVHEVISECIFIEQLLKLYSDFLKKNKNNSLLLDFVKDDKLFFKEFKKTMNSLLSYAWCKYGSPKDLVIFKEPAIAKNSSLFETIFDDSWKIVYMIRDPRSIISSLIKIKEDGFYSKRKRSLFNKIRFSIKRHSFVKRECKYIYPNQEQIHKMYHKYSLCEDFKDKYFFCKYEDYVNNKRIEELKNFLGKEIITTTNANARTGKTLERHEFFLSEEAGKPVVNTNINKYKSNLTKKNISYIERKFSFFMKEFGYL